MASLNLKCSFSIVVRGKTIEGWHGTDGDNDAADAFTLTVDGKVEDQPGVLPDTQARDVWVAASDFPGAFDYAFLVADQDLDVQVVGSSTSHVEHLKAGVPKLIGYQKVLGVAATTDIVADATPAYETIAKIRINNRSGTDANYHFFCVD